MDRREQLLRFDSADVPQRVLEDTLLGGDLRRCIEMLHAATAADAEMRTAWRDSLRAGFDQLHHAGLFVVRLFAIDLDRHPFADQRVFDEHGLAVNARNAAPFLVERGDDNVIHGSRERKAASRRKHR